jgi:hypothetical protein
VLDWLEELDPGESEGGGAPVDDGVAGAVVIVTVVVEGVPDGAAGLLAG